MCSLAVHLLYHLLNLHPEVLCERFFYQGAGLEPRSIESNRSLKEFDIIMFTISYENDYANAVRMLIDAGIKPLAMDRKNKDPIIISGGIIVSANPLPLKEVFDAFAIGEAEVLLPRIIESLLNSAFPLNKDRELAKSILAEIEGMYVPDMTQKVRRVFVRSLDEAPYPSSQIVVEEAPEDYMPIFGRTFLLETSRGCPYACRFCLLSYVTRPYRKRSLKRILRLVDEGLLRTRSRKISIISSAPEPDLEEILSYCVERNLEVSLPSIRIDKMDTELAALMKRAGQRTLTIAPEVADERLMEIINKEIDLAEVMNNLRIAYEAGFDQVKLYFMIGLPGERLEHMDKIGTLVRRIAELGFKKPRAIRLSINPLIPKPHTPFQWLPMCRLDSIRLRLKRLMHSLKGMPQVDLEFLDPRWARIQAILSRGDERLSPLLIEVARMGPSLSAWNTVLRRSGLLEEYCRELSPDEELPWDFIDVGISKSILRREYDKVLSLL
ncbi:MAG: hypothetical protein DRN15_03085 [Thermoprotei archaeon]|nr:MAG: hypothetical protein DRN15_03085 [Thermoprotei archaeon]RLF25045.1 MAG: hypothetical protein DRM97_02460 [Thermoprotei archaeon]